MSLWQDPSTVALQEPLIGRYSLERELGRGGMGRVYLAREVRLDRAVAIKVLHADLARRPEARARFLREARLAARLAHPHIVPIYAVETAGDLVFLVMAYIDGETLGERLRRRGALPPDDAERVLRETAWALGYAHARGVVHRDLTPENILLDRGTGRAVLADFGLAGETDVAERGPVFGTPGYLAPEAIRGDPTDARSDLYALGVIGWTALAGRAPFTADTTAQLLAKHLVQSAPPLAPLAAGASRRLVAAVEGCLAKDPDARPADATAWLALLDRTPEPVAIAPALRAWFTRWERIRPAYALATPILALQTYLLLWTSLRTESSMLLTVAAISSILTVTAIPIASHLIFEALSLRRLHRLGFGIHDIRAAYGHWREALRRERRGELPPLAGRVVFDLTVVGSVVLLVVLGLVLPRLPGWYSEAYEAAYVRRIILEMMGPTYLATLTGIGIGFAAPGFRLRSDGVFRRLVERFWHSRLADGITRLASLGQRRVHAASSTLHRNTELVLGLAIDDLWRAMPRSLRDGLGDVPSLATTLQRSAVELRDLVDGLRHDLAEGLLADDAAATADFLDARHRETVAVLERIRLQLLRSLAVRTTTRDLTDQLDAAVRLEALLVADLAGHAGARRVLRPPAAGRTTSPARTPTPSAA